MEFGELVTNLRRRAKLTQKDLAEKVEISIQYLNQIERGRALDTIGKEIIKKIGSALDIPIEHYNKFKIEVLNPSVDANNQTEDLNSKLLEVEKVFGQKAQIMLNDTISRQDDRINDLSEQVKFLKKMLEEYSEVIRNQNEIIKQQAELLESKNAQLLEIQLETA